MGQDLKSAMRDFCRRFRLKYNLRYSYKLTQEEINALNLVGSKELTLLLSGKTEDYSKVDYAVDSRLNGLGGMGMVERFDDGLLKDAKDPKRKTSIAKYLRHNVRLSGLLSSAAKKIGKGGLIGTIPVPKYKSDPSVFQRFQLDSMLVHESIHFVLQKNGISFCNDGLSPLDEGLCVFLHFRFARSTALYRYDMSNLTKRYRTWASFFDKLLKGVPDEDIVRTVRESPVGKLKRGISNA